MSCGVQDGLKSLVQQLDELKKDINNQVGKVYSFWPCELMQEALCS